MLARPPDFLHGLYPRSVHQVLPFVRPADVEVHDDPGHRELRERVDVRQRERADHLHVQHRRERRQKRQPEVEEHEEDRRRYDECPLAPHYFLEGRGSFHANPLVGAVHRAPFRFFPNRLGTIWDALYTVKRIRLRVRDRLSGGKKEPPSPEARGVLVVRRSRCPYALAPSGWGAVASEPRLGGRTIKATIALAAMIPARIKKASEYESVESITREISNGPSTPPKLQAVSMRP